MRREVAKKKGLWTKSLWIRIIFTETKWSQNYVWQISHFFFFYKILRSCKNGSCLFESKFWQKFSNKTSIAGIMEEIYFRMGIITRVLFCIIWNWGYCSYFSALVLLQRMHTWDIVTSISQYSGIPLSKKGCMLNLLCLSDILEFFWGTILL